MSTNNIKRIKELLTNFEFQELFVEELGWERQRGKNNIEVGEEFFEVAPVAEKKGLVALVCQPIGNSPFPDSAKRKRIEKEVAQLHFEHLIIFIDSEQTRQTWQVPKREGGKTKGHSETTYYAGKGVEHLARRIDQISFTLGETDEVSLLEVTARVNQALLAEKVTKKFFREFSDKRKGFVKFLDWIEDEAKRHWYCSVLLNRLMFIYFLGGKGFLPGGTGFLSHSLNENINVNGANTFYTHFLLPLSFFGLGERQGNRGKFEETFKEVLYLDGGLFAVHQVERELGLDKESVEKGTLPEAAQIPDEEFKKWFAYFDAWRWTLDEDKVENEGYISPHILGYIFEKYINQKQMGAYYTKEDITGYICRNTIIPRLFDMLAETGGKGKQAVQPLPIGPHPNLFNEGRGISDGEGIDRYVYPSVKQHDKLPTETDYEQTQRLKRYESILEDFDAGKIAGIDDFITYNLDIERLALDFVSNIQDPEVLHAFYFRGLQQITVLDPTCGSGAFLFAALNILYPLYNAALSRMRYLVGKATGSEPDIVNWAGRLNFDDLEAGQGIFADVVGDEPKVVADLRAEVERIKEHPSAEYFIKKSIIVNNLFGVDIMEEAVEICKLRLFLTLIATVERDDKKDNYGVEPLPDIDFNILAGNTLVGYTSISDIDRLWHEVEIENGTFVFEKDHSRLQSLISEYSKLLSAWRQQQLGDWRGARITKAQMMAAVEAIRPELDGDLWRLYKTAGLIADNLTLKEFKKTHGPLHWLLEFPQVEARGGFDVIVGNPPYVEISKTLSKYRLLGYKTEKCGNLYATCTERSIHLWKENGYLSMVVQLPIACSPRMTECLSLMRLQAATSWFAFFDDRPAKLFDGLEHIRATIFNLKQGADRNQTYSTRYHKWYTEQRDQLFQGLAFIDSSEFVIPGFVPKDGSTIAHTIRRKLMQHPPVSAFVRNTGNPLFYHNAPQYWMRFTDFVPYFFNERDGETQSSHVKVLNFSSEQEMQAASILLNSSIFYWFFTSLSNCRDLTGADIARMRGDITELVLSYSTEVKTLHDALGASLKANAIRKHTMYKQTGTVIYDEFRPRLSASEYFAIDELLFDFFEFDDDQRAFIRNYDRNIRLGNTD